MQLEFDRRELRFAQPQTTAFGVLRSRELVELTLTGADGIAGHGEAAALEPYDGVSTERVITALEAYRAPLAASARSAGGTLLDACRAADALPQALAAIDIALWDLAGKRAGRPICELLSESPATAIAVNASVAAATPRRAARAAADAVAEGYSCIKLKLGFADDLDRVAAVREAIGPDVSLRLDANGAWGVAAAEQLLSRRPVRCARACRFASRSTRPLRCRAP